MQSLLSFCNSILPSVFSSLFFYSFYVLCLFFLSTDGWSWPQHRTSEFATKNLRQGENVASDGGYLKVRKQEKEEKNAAFYSIKIALVVFDYFQTSLHFIKCFIIIYCSSRERHQMREKRGGKWHAATEPQRGIEPETHCSAHLYPSGMTPDPSAVRSPHCQQLY